MEDGGIGKKTMAVRAVSGCGVVPRVIRAPRVRVRYLMDWGKARIKNVLGIFYSLAWPKLNKQSNFTINNYYCGKLFGLQSGVT